MSEYDYLNARIKGMSTQLLKRSFFEEALALPGEKDVVDTLLNSSYGPDLRDALEEGYNVRHIEAGLGHHLCTTFHQVRGMAPAVPQRLLDITFRWWDLRNIVTLLRGKQFDVAEDKIFSGLFPAGRFDNARLLELAGEPTVIALADTLVTWGNPGAGHLRALLHQYPQAREIGQVEAGLFRHHFTWAHEQTAGDDDNHRLMRRHLERQIDVINVIGSLRAIRDEQTDSFAPVGRGFLRSDFLQKLCKSRELDAAIELLAGTYFAEAIERGIFAFGEHSRIGVLEHNFEKSVLTVGCRLFRTDPLGIGVAAGYLWRKFTEFLNLRILLRGKAFGRPSAAIQEEMLFV